MIDDDFVIKYFIVKDKRRCIIISGHKTKNIPNEIKEYLENRFTDSSSIHETIKRIYYNIEEKPKCPVCGKPVAWLGKQNRLFLNTCSFECGVKLRTEHIKTTCLKKYGVENCWQAEEKKEKIKNTLLVKYGVDNAQRSDEIKLRTQQTCLEKYGHTNFGGGEEAKRKIKQTKIERYGDPNYVNVQKMKQTKNERYGDPNYVNVQKMKETCLAKYGSTSWLNSEDRKNRYFELKTKINETKHKNHTFTRSKAESVVYNILRKIFDKGDILCQYISEEYPFDCDFYIKSINTYIEYQGFYTHGGHPFDKNDKKDIDEVLYLQYKNEHSTRPNKNLYAVKLYIWTENDVEKRNTAKANNLNYIEFWNFEEVNNWVTQYERKNN